MNESRESRGGRVEVRDQDAGTISNVAGDQKYYISADLASLAPSGLGQRIIVAGLLISFAGFASFGYVVISFIVEIYSQMQTQNYGPPTVAFVPWLPLGAGLTFAGIVVSIFGFFVRRRRRPNRK